MKENISKNTRVCFVLAFGCLLDMGPPLSVVCILNETPVEKN